MDQLLCASLSHTHYWYEVGMYVCICGHTYSKSMDQPGKVANPARGTCLRIWSRETGPAVPSRVSLLIVHTQAEYGAYSRGSSRVPRRRPFIYLKPPYAIGSVPSLSGHAIAYRWRSLPRVRRHWASKPQGSSERVLPWQVTKEQLLCACLPHIHYWYEVGMYVCIYSHTYSKSMDQPGKVANRARGQLNREKNIFPCPRSRLRICSRETGSAVPSRVSLLISILRLNMVLTHGVLPEFRGGVHLFF